MKVTSSKMKKISANMLRIVELDAINTSSNTNIICVLNNSSKDYQDDNQTN